MTNQKLKKYRIIYSFNHSIFGFNNSITVKAYNVDDAIKEAKEGVLGAYGTKMIDRFTFKLDVILCGEVI
jgi:hypothetical protein